MIQETPSLESIQAANRAVINEVTAEILKDPGSPTTGDEPRYSQVPKFTRLVAGRNHDLLCLPTD